MFLFQLQKQEVKRDDTSGKISQDNAFIKDVAESSYEKPHTYWSVAGLNSLSTKKAQENAELAVSMMQEMGALKSDWKAADGLNDNELKLFKFIFKMLITRDLGRESAKYTRDFFSDGNGKLLKGTCEDILKEVWDSDTKGSGLVDNDDSIGEKSGSKRWWRDIAREIVGEIKPAAIAPAPVEGEKYNNIADFSKDIRVSAAMNLLGITQENGTYGTKLDSYKEGESYSVTKIREAAKQRLEQDMTNALLIKSYWELVGNNPLLLNAVGAEKGKLLDYLATAKIVDESQTAADGYTEVDVGGGKPKRYFKFSDSAKALLGNDSGKVAQNIASASFDAKEESTALLLENDLRARLKEMGLVGDDKKLTDYGKRIWPDPATQVAIETYLASPAGTDVDGRLLTKAVGSSTLSALIENASSVNTGRIGRHLEASKRNINLFLIDSEGFRNALLKKADQPRNSAEIDRIVSWISVSGALAPRLFESDGSLDLEKVKQAINAPSGVPAIDGIITDETKYQALVAKVQADAKADIALSATLKGLNGGVDLTQQQWESLISDYVYQTTQSANKPSNLTSVDDLAAAIVVEIRQAYSAPPQ